MRIALTGATGFVGQAIQRLFSEHKIPLKAWFRGNSSPENLNNVIEWVPGELGNRDAVCNLLEGCDSVIHTALFRPGESWQADEGDLNQYLNTNLLGSLQLFEEAFQKGIKRFIFVSTCAVHDNILEDRKLDEAHPLWPQSHYGAHKAALEAFVSSYGLGKDFSICSIRPTGIYGIKNPLKRSKWYTVIEHIARGKDVTCSRGGKEVHVDDVAKAILLLLQTDSEIKGEAFNCYDRYISEWEVAHIAKDILGGKARILGKQTSPKHQIETSKIKKLGMEFGGEKLLQKTIENMIQEMNQEL